MTAETTPVVADQARQQCQNCRNFATHMGGTMCRLAPPQAVLVGVAQGNPGGAALLTPGRGQNAMTPIVQGFFAPTLPTAWCGQWRAMDFTGPSPELPPKPKQEYRT